MDQDANIKSSGKPGSLYEFLQEQSLEQVQRMAGKIWTDYNPHDPGVTTLDTLNYALFELDYRLSFPLEDYLTTARRPFIPEQYGLFGPDAVLSMNPATPDDYRSFILNEIEGIEDVQIKVRPPAGREDCLGWYDLFVELSPATEPGNPQKQEKKIKEAVDRLYHSHRNLGENLFGIHFVQQKKLRLTGDIETDGSVRPEDLLISIYQETVDLFASGKDKNIDDIPLYDLYKKVKNIRGVTVIRSLDLEEPEQKGGPYTVAISQEEDIRIRLFRQGQPLQADTNYVLRRLHAGNRLRHLNRKQRATPPKKGYEGKHHEMTHTSIQNDFPECYGLNSRKARLHQSEEQSLRLRQFKAYLLLFDLFLATGLEEVNRLPEWIALDPVIFREKRVRVSIPDDIWELLIEEEAAAHSFPGADKRAEQNKHRLLDTLDKLYGTDSNPAYVQLADPAANLERRVRFLKQIPELLRKRSTGIDLRNASSVSGLEQYLTTLLGLDLSGERAYVIEHLLLYPTAAEEGEPDDPPVEVIEYVPSDPLQLPMEFTVSVILPVCERPVEPAEFRIRTEELVAERLPAHLHFDLYWLTQAELRLFHHYYESWRQAWANGNIKQRNWTAGILAGCLIELKNRTKNN